MNNENAIQVNDNKLINNENVIQVNNTVYKALDSACSLRDCPYFSMTVPALHKGSLSFTKEKRKTVVKLRSSYQLNGNLKVLAMF